MGRLAGPLVAATLLGVMLAGCTDDGSGTASISVYLQGVPESLGGRYTDVHLRIASVELLWDGPRGEGGYAAGAAGGWRVLAGDQTLQIADVHNGTALFVGEFTVEAGSYTTVRLPDLVGTGIARRDDGRILELSATKADVPLTIDVQQGTEARLVIQVGLDSWKRDPLTESWKAKPYIADLDVLVVDDAASGTDVHEPGQLVALAGS